MEKVKTKKCDGEGKEEGMMQGYRILIVSKPPEKQCYRLGEVYPVWYTKKEALEMLRNMNDDEVYLVFPSRADGWWKRDERSRWVSLLTNMLNLFKEIIENIRADRKARRNM